MTPINGTFSHKFSLTFLSKNGWIILLPCHGEYVDSYQWWSIWLFLLLPSLIEPLSLYQDQGKTYTECSPVVGRRPCPMVQTFVHSSSPGSTLTEPDFRSEGKESFTSIGFVFSRLYYISCYKQKEIKHPSLLLSLFPQVQQIASSFGSFEPQSLISFPAPVQ